MVSNFLAVENFAHRAGIAQIGLVDRDPVRDRRDVGALDLRIIKIVEVVQDRDPVPFPEQLLDKVRPDEAGAARDENFHCARVRRKRSAGKRREP